MTQKSLSIARAALLALAIGTVAIPVISYAQNTPDQAQTQPQRPGGQARQRGQGGQMGQQLEQLVQQLDLSDEQKAQLKPILEDLRQQVQQSRQNNATPEQRRESMRQAMATARQQIKDILTPEQRTKLAELMQQRGAATQPAARATGGPGGMAEMMVDRLENIALGLDLTADQQTKVKDLSKEYKDELAAIVRDSAGNRPGPQIRTAVQEYRSRLTQLLTPEQTDQFNKKVSELPAARFLDGSGGQGGFRGAGARGQRAQRGGARGAGGAAGVQ